MSNLLDQLESILDTTKAKESWVIVDEKGKQHSLDAGIAGTPKKIDESDIKKQVVESTFGKERISSDDIVALLKYNDALVQYFYNSAAYASKKGLKAKLKEHFKNSPLVQSLDK